MKPCYFYFFVGILLTSIQLTYGQENHQKSIIVIDPGHGGTDSGAVGVNGLEEKDVTLKIAMEVLRLNKELFGDTLEIYSTRYSDTLISLGHRTKLFQVLKGNIFISLHCNQTGNSAVKGIEVYIRHRDRQSAFLGTLFLAGFNRTLGYKNRGVKYGNFQVLRETGHSPGVLLELGFLSNAEEERHHGKAASISAYALLILETLGKYINYD